MALHMHARVHHRAVAAVCTSLSGSGGEGAAEVGCDTPLNPHTHTTTLARMCGPAPIPHPTPLLPQVGMHAPAVRLQLLLPHILLLTRWAPGCGRALHRLPVLPRAGARVCWGMSVVGMVEHGRHAVCQAW